MQPHHVGERIHHMTPKKSSLRNKKNKQKKIPKKTNSKIKQNKKNKQKNILQAQTMFVFRIFTSHNLCSPLLAQMTCQNMLFGPKVSIFQFQWFFYLFFYSFFVFYLFVFMTQHAYLTQPMFTFTGPNDASKHVIWA